MGAADQPPPERRALGRVHPKGQRRDHFQIIQFCMCRRKIRGFRHTQCAVLVDRPYIARNRRDEHLEHTGNLGWGQPHIAVGTGGYGYGIVLDRYRSCRFFSCRCHIVWILLVG